MCQSSRINTYMILCVLISFTVVSGQGPRPDPSIPSTSAPIHQCDFNPCLNGGFCVNLGSTFTCICDPYHTGVVCQDASIDDAANITIKQCDFNPCLNGGFCVSVGSNYTCICEASHTGVVCQYATTTIARTTEAATTGTTSTTTAPSTTTTTAAAAQCSNNNVNINNLGCSPAEVVFMLEYGASDSRGDVDHEGDFIKDVLHHWNVNPAYVRAGMVLYHDTVSEVIHIDDFRTERGIHSRINTLTRFITPSGTVDLAGALDYVRLNSFKNARPGVPKVVIPIMHQLPPPDQNDRLISAAEKLKDSCVTVIAMYVRGQPSNTTLVQQLVSPPTSQHYRAYSDFDDLEDEADHFNSLRC